MSKRYSLTANWRFTLDAETSDLSGLPEDGFPIGKWFPADVPGTVHTDLMRNEIIDDPFYRDNELKVSWVDEVGWLYRTEFDLPDVFFEMNAIQLVAEGLDTVADIFLNGHPIAHTENMFISHRFDIKQYLTTGNNELSIRFHSPTLVAKAIEAEHGQLSETHEPHRLYLRKAQYSFGWDWGPKLPTSGIWKPIYLEAFQAGRLANLFVNVELGPSLRTATIQIQTETEWFRENSTGIEVQVEVDGRKKVVPCIDGQALIGFEMDQPKLWWPAGYGEQPLYEISAILLQNDQEIDSLSSRFAVRKVELVQENDEWGKSFYFKINNVPVFCKGANWIPADSFLPRIDEAKYRKLLQMAKDANMNMIRVWGGGIYEPDVFYGVCDELGLLVWQDFMFACGGYPEHTEYRKNLTSEIEQVVKRLRNHPCLVIWCGNNENEWIWYDANACSYQDMPGLSLFHELIPDLLKKLDPLRPYWPSSPFGGADPNLQEEGNQHQWSVWSRWVDFTRVLEDNSRFITEFGFQAAANFATLEEVTLPEDRDPQSEIMEFHNKQVEGQERLFRFLAGHVKMATSFEDFIYKTQLVQGEALKTCLEHWRRNKFRTAGTIVWQLNDCWPVSSWSLIDSQLKPKAAYYYVRRAFASALVSFSQTGEHVGIWTTHDGLRELDAILKIKGLSFVGDLLFERELSIKVPANGSATACELHLSELALDEARDYLKAELHIDGQQVCENRYYFKRLKHLKLPEPEFKARISQSKPESAVLHLSSSCFAKSVRICITGAVELQENWFDLDAGTEKHIEITLSAQRELTEADVQITSLLS